MKKIVLTAIALSVLMVLYGCVSVSPDVKEPTDVKVNGVEDTTVNAEESSSSVSDKKEVTIEESVLVEELGVKITAKGFGKDSIFGPQIKLLIENNSGKELTFQTRDSSVNGYMIDTLMSVDVANGKKANDTLTFSKSELEKCGIESIADMEFSFHIFDSDWETFLDTEKIQIKTSVADTYEYKFDDSGKVLYDNGGIRIVAKGLTEDSSIFGSEIIVYIENNSGEDITVQTRDTSVDGFMVDTIFSSDVINGKKIVDTIILSSTDLEENDIEVIKEVETSFHIYESETWETIVDTDKVVISF